MFGPDLLVPGLLGAESSDHAEEVSVSLTPCMSRRDCLWVLILGISSSPLRGLRVGRAGGVRMGWSLWLGVVQKVWKHPPPPHLPHYHLLEELGGLETRSLGRKPSALAEPGDSQDVFGEGLQSKIRAP